MPCTASALQKTSHAIASTVLIVWHLVKLMLWQNKPNVSRKSENLPFNLHGSQRGLSFHLYLVYLGPPAAATTDAMYWKTGNIKSWKIMKK